MCRLIFLVLRAGMIKVRQLVEGELSFAFRRPKKVRFSTAVARQFAQFLHACIASGSQVVATHAASASELLNAGVDHSSPEAMLEALVKIPDVPKFFFDPAVFDPLLECAKRSSGEIAFP